MFWKLVTLAMLLWAVGIYLSITLGGLIHLLPVMAIGCVIVRQMGRRPDSEFGRWRPASQRAGRR